MKTFLFGKSIWKLLTPFPAEEKKPRVKRLLVVYRNGKSYPSVCPESASPPQNNLHTSCPQKIPASVNKKGWECDQLIFHHEPLAIQTYLRSHVSRKCRALNKKRTEKFGNNTLINGLFQISQKPQQTTKEGVRMEFIAEI